MLSEPPAEPHPPHGTEVQCPVDRAGPDGFFSPSGERPMKVAPTHPQEEARLAALDSLEILDTLPEAGFDELTRLASHLCGAPIALVSLVDHYRQWFKSRIGLEVPETPRDFAFCAHAILGEQLFV